MSGIVAVIEIPFSPNVFQIGNFALSWHGLLSVVAIIVAVIVSVAGARRLMVNVDHVYNLAPFAIIGGLIGARLVHVIDRWEFYTGQPITEVFRIWEGGIALWGRYFGRMARWVALCISCWVSS